MTPEPGGWRLDHVFAFCRPEAPEAARLAAAGMRVGVQRRHAGQGTANVCFCFADCYLELIWIADAAEAASAASAVLGLTERARWRELGGSPFGICLRPTAGATAPPFDGIDYAPPHLPAGMRPLRIARGLPAGAPMWFALERDYTPPAVAHVLWQRRLAQAALVVPDLAASSPLATAAVPGVSVRAGARHALTLEFDGPADGRVVDLHPELPLVLRW